MNITSQRRIARAVRGIVSTRLGADRFCAENVQVKLLELLRDVSPHVARNVNDLRLVADMYYTRHAQRREARVDRARRIWRADHHIERLSYQHDSLLRRPLEDETVWDDVPF